MSEVTNKPYVGVDVGGTKILAVLVTSEGQITARFKQSTRQDGTPLADQVAYVVDGLLKEAQLDIEDVAGIGLGVPGVVDSQTGRFVKAPNLQIDDPELAQRVHERYGVPVAIGNDVNLGTLAEVWLGAGKGKRNVVGVFPGTGIGGGVIIDGQLVYGAEDLGGEIGHLVLMVDGPQCGCGNRGCWEALASRTAIERDIRQALAEGRQSRIMEFAKDGQIKSGSLRDALDAGDELTTEIMQKAGHYLGQGILTIRHLIDPELIILGGGLIEACGDFLIPIIEAEVRADNMKGSRDVFKIAVSELGDDAVALGAAALLRRQLSGKGTDMFASLSPEQAEPPEEEVSYPTIDDVRFGSVVVGGSQMPHDIYIRADGKVARRKKKPARKKYGTSHVLDRAELEKVCKGQPQTLIIGTGHQGMLRLADDAREYLDSLRIQWRALRTPEAVKAFNEARGRKALLLHVTC